METFVTSDHHFNHANIMKYCNRNFLNITVHDETLIWEWNNVVKKHDIVYYLGDFTLSSSIADFIFRLNGDIRILSNPWHHDQRWIEKPSTRQLVEFGVIDLVGSIVVLEPKESHVDVPIVLCHYPFEVWDRKHYGALHFHGHSHGELHRVEGRLDVGVDMAYKLLGSYRPFELSEATSYSSQLMYRPT